MERSVPDPASLPDLTGLLSCPDDLAGIEVEGPTVRCSSCGRRFPRHPDGVVELLPSNPACLPAAGLSQSYRRGYYEEFGKKYPANPGARAWGAPESSLPSWIRKRERQVRFIASLLSIC